ncbi:uncharacterized protein LOC128855364 [Anastrepha ludens]|uniref:uncharacterized protein LOC128855364 n=1 Tax=Anastrepha ludens TaxID=28586 RepID=UPI0023B045DC|nr:uncharacterized protein LOC128855364 [Anastrepha ludens]
MKMTQFVQRGSGIEEPLSIAAKSAEIRIAAFCAEHNIPYAALDHLSDLLKSSFSDSKIAHKIVLKRTKETAIVKNVIGETEKCRLAEKLKITKFSVLTDESTDISATKTSCLLARYFDEEEGKIVSKFWDLVQVLQPGKVTSATAEHLYNNIIASFKERGIPMANIVGFGSDGCSVMMGVHNSVASRLKRDLPHITIMKCTCHSLHLCASEACEQLPRTCEDFARNIHNFFNSSSKRQSEYVEFQMFSNVEVHKLLHPSQTRWLSLATVVDRILEQWPALLLYFTDQWLTIKLKMAQSIYECLNDPFNKLFFFFLQWVLPKFTGVNKYFQSAKVVITDLHEVMIDLYKTLLYSFMKRNYVNSRPLSEVDPEDKVHYLPMAEMYLGVQVLLGQQSRQVQERLDLLTHFREKCQAFLICACVQIKKRVCEQENYQDVDDQWRRLCSYPLGQEIKALDTDVFWATLLSIQNEGGVYLFQNLSRCVLSILSLPHSNADSERVFSKVNLIKTKLRNRLIVPTVRGTLLASQHVQANGGCAVFKPSKEMISRMTKDTLYDKPKETRSTAVDSGEEDGGDNSIFEDV